MVVSPLSHRRLAPLALAALAPLFAGCATVVNARLAQDPDSAVAGERTPTAAELGLPVTGRVVLDELVRTALRVQPSVVKARHAVDIAAARVVQVEAALLPIVTTSASLSYRDQSETDGQRTSVRPPRRFNTLGFDVSWLIFDFGRTEANARSAGEQWLAAQADLRSAEVDAAFDVHNAYFDLAKQDQLLVVARETVRQFAARLDQVSEQVRVGKRIRYDVTKSEVDLGNARLAEVQARNAKLTAQANLANAIGVAEVVDWVADIDGNPTQPPPDFDATWAEARRAQPRLAAATARELAASAIVDARIAELYPSVDLSLSYARSGSELPLPWSFAAGPSIRWTPFDGFQNLSSIDEAVASLRNARASRAEVEQLVWLNLRTAWIAIEDARQRYELTTLTVRSAEENLAFAQGRFDVGAGTSVELSDAQQALAQARADQVQARADYEIARARLRQATGVTGVAVVP